MRTWFAISCLFESLILSGCVRVPQLYEDGIAVSDIVQRVKCEVWAAIPRPEPPYPTGRYQWMGDWTAKVDLTLITNDQSAITPTASFVDPMRPATLPLIGTVARSFTYGVGAGLTTTAIRTETMSFTLSIKELQNESYRGKCDVPDAADLYGRLGLQEWVTSALAPVDRDALTIGVHAPPGSKVGGSPRIAVSANDKEKIQQQAFLAGKSAATAEEFADSAARYVLQYTRDVQVAPPKLTKRDIQLIFETVERAKGEADTAIQFAKVAKDVFTHLKDDDPLKKDAEVLKSVADAAAADQRAAAAKRRAVAAGKRLPQDAPIDSIGHQIQFIVVANASFTPSWSLVHFKGPGATGTFAAATETRTHTLNIALGAPAGSVNASIEQIRQLNNLQLNSLRLQPNQ